MLNLFLGANERNPISIESYWGIIVLKSNKQKIMQTKKRKLFGLSLLLFLAMIITWNSCTKQDEVNLNDTKYQITDIEKAINKAEQNSELFKYRTLEYRNDSITSCFTPDSLGCNGDLVFDGTFEREVQVYDNCKAKVKYDQWRCWEVGFQQPPTVIFTFYFDNFFAEPILGECDSVILLWNNLLSNGQYNEYLESVEKFIRDAQLATEAIVIQEWMDLLGVFFECNDPNTTLYSEFYTSNCYQTYLKFWIKGGVFDWDIVELSCGESCCKRTTYYCLGNNGEVIASDPLIVQVGDCALTPPDNIRTGYFPIGDCEHECE